MATLHMRLHPGLIPDTGATWRQRHRTPHLRQGDLDGSCGQACVFMSMILLRIARWSEIRTLRMVSSGRYEDTHRQALETWFVGTTDEGLLGLLNTLRPRIRYRHVQGSMKIVRNFALERLAKDELVIMGINKWGSRRGHWTLAIGTEIRRIGPSSDITGILCLDPVESSPTIGCFNAKIDLLSPALGARHVHYRTEGHIRNVTCSSAISVALRR